MTRKARRRILKANIEFISLCPRGKNRLRVLYKEDSDGQGDPPIEFRALTKDLGDGRVLAAVYAPDTDDVDGDLAGAEVIQEMAHTWAKNGSKLDLRHDGKALSKDQAFVAESFIVQKGDARFDGMTDELGREVDMAGGWATVIQLEDEGLKEAYASGAWGGVSLFGDGIVEPLEKEDDRIERVVKQLEDLIDRRGVGGNDDIELDMTPEELKAAIDAGVKEALAKQAQEQATEDDTADDAKDEDEIPFEGDPTSAEDLEAHAQKVRFAKLDKSDPEAVLAYAKSLQKSDTSDDGEGDDAYEGEPDEIARLKRELARLEKARKESRTPVGTETTGGVDDDEDEQATWKRLAKERGHKLVKLTDYLSPAHRPRRTKQGA